MLLGKQGKDLSKESVHVTSCSEVREEDKEVTLVFVMVEGTLDCLGMD